jgi:hypothetical protein
MATRGAPGREACRGSGRGAAKTGRGSRGGRGKEKGTLCCKRDTTRLSKQRRQQQSMDDSINPTIIVDVGVAVHLLLFVPVEIYQMSAN